MRRNPLSALLAVMVVMAVAAGALAKTHQDPIGDVEGPLDIKKVSLDWNSKTVKGKFTTVEDIEVGTLSFINGGIFWFDLVTGVTDTGYAYIYTVLVTAEDGDLYGSLVGAPQNGDTTFIDEIEVSMPSDNTIRFEIPRSLIEGDKKKSKFTYWFRTTYSSQAVCGGLCEDLAPDGDDVYTGKF